VLEVLGAPMPFKRVRFATVGADLAEEKHFSGIGVVVGTLEVVPEGQPHLAGGAAKVPAGARAGGGFVGQVNIGATKVGARNINFVGT